jgi:hypothetical protein
MTKLYTCKHHDHAHSYVACADCGHQYCPHYWRSCPRCNGNGYDNMSNFNGKHTIPPTGDAIRHLCGYIIHELTHWTGAKSRLERDFSGRFGTHAYALEELVAEIGAAFLCAEFGFDIVSRSAGYLDHWLQACKANPRAIFAAASNASKAAEYLRGLALAEPVAMAA